MLAVARTLGAVAAVALAVMLMRAEAPALMRAEAPALRGAEALATDPPERLPDPPSITFDSEWVGLYVADDSLEVRGTFRFRCRGDSKGPIPLFLPFPRDSLMGEGRMVSLLARAGIDSFTPARWEKVPTTPGARWWLPPCSGDSIVARMTYRQKIEPGYASYIVRTIRNWGQPLRRAQFEVRLPEGAVPIEFSFPFERREIDGEVVFCFEAVEFFPDHDIVVRYAP